MPESVELGEPTDSGGSTMHGTGNGSMEQAGTGRADLQKKARRKRIIVGVILLLIIIIIVLLAVIIHLLATRGSTASTSGPKMAAEYGRPLRRWREQQGGACPSRGAACPEGPVPVLLVSLDGFRADYLRWGVTPTLQDMIDCGVTTPYVRVSFPSKTFPNHYSIVTGMYPESHGVVGNTMYDPELPGRKFKLGAPESFNKVWWNAEPVWQAVQKQGDRSAVYFWPGSEVPGQLPSEYRAYDKKVPYDQRVDQVVAWLRQPAPRRPRYLSLYFDEPDSTGHSHGPNSDEVKEAVRMVDDQLANLYSQLIDHGLLGCVDVIVTSDHGMAEMREGCANIALEDYVPGLANMSATYVNGPVARIRPHNISHVPSLVSRLDCAHPALRVWQRRELPVRWHHQHNDRIEPLLATTDLGYGLSIPTSTFCLRGMHGWDPDLLDMRAMFVAQGPSLRQSYQTAPFENVQLYSLLQTLLQLPDVENNATKHSLDHLLLHPPPAVSAAPSIVSAAPESPPQRPPPGGDTLELTLANDCCQRMERCSCEALRVWRQQLRPQTTNVSLPAAEEASLIEYSADANLVAALPTGIASRYRWVQYELGPAAAAASSLRAEDATCRFHSPAVAAAGGATVPTTADAGGATCTVAEDDRHVSIVVINGTDSYLQRIVKTMYPMNKDFREQVLAELRARLGRYTRQYRRVVVLAGPVYLADGVPSPHGGHRDGGAGGDPSHFFYQLRLCRTEDCAAESTDHKQWILPNVETLRTCEPVSKYVDFHEATLRDIEWVSGLRLFQLQSDRSHARFITRLPEFRPPRWSDAQD